jgi:hypothetical protein
MRKILIFLTLLLAATFFVTGCSSDSTAPNDELPALEAEDVAGQSGYMAMAMVEVAPLALEYDGSAKADETDGNYVYTFGATDDIQGTVLLHFREGGADGTPCGYDVADYGRGWTADEAPLTIEIIEGGVPWELGFVLESIIDQAADSAVVDGSGTLTMGDYEAGWTVEDLEVVASGDWPEAGVLTFTNGGFTATVTFDGTGTAIVTIGEASWSLNLGSGELTER